jgi:hypothetical protein
MSKYNYKIQENTFIKLGEKLLNPDAELQEIIENEKHYNGWFTPQNVLQAINSVAKMLNEDSLNKWLKNYNFSNKAANKRIGLILAGNLPLVGFHDVLCVLITGNIALIKSSSQDARLIKYILERLVAIDSSLVNRYYFVDKLEGFDAIIATGSNNSSRYFNFYFGKVPHIIRKNRNSLAVLSGNETAEQIYGLGFDIFDYYGLGCRNVSKLLVPTGYNFNFFFESIEKFEPIINHHKYNNNYGYNKSIYLVNSDKHFDNNFLLLKEDDRLASPISVLFYKYYNEINDAEDIINSQSQQIQCVVTDMDLKVSNQIVDFGKTQQPELWDYADGVDTISFLLNL